MKVSTKISIVAGLVMSAVSGLSHAADIDDASIVNSPAYYAAAGFRALTPTATDSEVYAAWSKAAAYANYNGSPFKSDIYGHVTKIAAQFGVTLLPDNSALVYHPIIAPTETAAQLKAQHTPPTPNAPVVAPVAIKTPATPVKAVPTYNTISRVAASGVPALGVAPVPHQISTVAIPSAAQAAAQSHLQALQAASIAAKAGGVNNGAMDVQAHNDAVDMANFNKKFASVAAIEHKRHVMQDQQTAAAALSLHSNPTGVQVIAPPKPTIATPTPLPATPVIAPATPVKVAPQKLTQGGGVWAKAPDIKGTFAGSSVTVVRNQNMVQAPRPTITTVVNPDVIGQPISTTIIAKNTDTMTQGHNDPTGTPVEIVTHKDYSNKTPAAQDGIKDTPVSSTTTFVNQIAPAITVDKWGTNHTVVTAGGNNVKNNVTNAKDNATNKAAPVSTPAPAPAPTASTTTPAPVATTTTAAAPAAPTAAPAPASQTNNGVWQSQANTAINDLIDAHNENVTVLNDHSSRIDALESHEKSQDKRIEQNNRKAMAGIAGALAQTGLHYTDSANSIAAGVGTYAGQKAVAVGYSHQWGQKVRFSVQNSADTQHNFGASASVAIGW